MSTHEKLINYKIVNMCKKDLRTRKLGITQIDSMNLFVKLLNPQRKKIIEKTTSPQFNKLQLTHVLHHSKRLHVDTPNENSSCVEHIQSNQSKCEIEIPSQRILGKLHLLANTFSSTNI